MSLAISNLTDEIVCRCLQVSEAEIKTAAEIAEIPTVRCIGHLTGAGTGCTVCHRRIRAILADQCAAASSSPTCVSR